MSEPSTPLFQAMLSDLGRTWAHATEVLRTRPATDTRLELISVVQYSNADLVRGKFQGEPVRFYEFRGVLAEVSAEAELDKRQRGQFFRVGRASFYIRDDAQKGLFALYIGPRYGRTVLLEVGQHGEVSSRMLRVS